jgi:hypothetical protein
MRAYRIFLTGIDSGTALVSHGADGEGGGRRAGLEI